MNNWNAELSRKGVQGGQTDVIVMDFSRAFDKVDHQRLLLKLHQLGINTTVIAWIKSFLSGIHRMWSSMANSLVGACPVLSGVPHGSVLGPCLFLMYIKDMPDSIKSNIRLFACDTIMYLTITNHSLSSPTIRPYHSRILGE